MKYDHVVNFLHESLSFGCHVPQNMLTFILMFLLLSFEIEMMNEYTCIPFLLQLWVDVEEFPFIFSSTSDIELAYCLNIEEIKLQKFYTHVLLITTT